MQDFWYATPCCCNGIPPTNMLPHAAPMACRPMPLQWHALPCCLTNMPPHAFLMACHPTIPSQWHAAPMQCRPLCSPWLATPCCPSTLGPPICIAAKRPSAHPSILCHSLLLILVLNPTHCPSAHLYTLCNHNTINPSPCTIHPPAHLSALGRAHTLAHPSAMATIYPMGTCRMAHLVHEIVPSAGPSDMD